MSADIYEDDVAMFAEPAWHGLGQVFYRLLTADDLNGAFAHKTVEPCKTYAADETAEFDDDAFGPRYIEIPNKTTLVTADGHPVGVNSDKYGAVQPTVLEEAACRLLVEYPDLVAGCEAAVTIGHGTKQAITLRLVDQIVIEGYSTITSLLSLANAHDGTGAAKFGQVQGVTVCGNTYAMYIAGGGDFVVQTRHTANAEEIYAQAVNNLINQMEAQGEIAATIERLCDTTLDSFHDFVIDLTGDKPDVEGRALTNWEKRRDGLYERWNGEDIAPIKGSVWSALMAVQGYEQHVQSVRKVDRRVRHLDNVLFGRMPLTEKAFATLVNPWRW
jgi:phage/plasmid-like protein (TIGR03299 family)